MVLLLLCLALVAGAIAITIFLWRPWLRPWDRLARLVISFNNLNSLPPAAILSWCMNVMHCRVPITPLRRLPSDQLLTVLSLALRPPRTTLPPALTAREVVQHFISVLSQLAGEIGSLHCEPPINANLVAAILVEHILARLAGSPPPVEITQAAEELSAALTHSTPKRTQAILLSWLSAIELTRHENQPEEVGPGVEVVRTS